MKHANIRFGKRIAAFVLAVVLFFPVSLFSGSTDVSAASSGLTDATVKKYEEQLEALAAKQKEIERNLSTLRSQQASWQSEKAAIDSYLNTTERKIEAAELLSAELRAQIETTEAEIQNTKAEYDRAMDQFLTEMVISYEDGEASYLGLILGADSLGDFLSRLEQISALMEFKKTVMKTLDTKRKQLEEKDRELIQKLAVQTETLEQLELDRIAYTKEADAAIARIAELEKDESAALKLYYANKAEEDKLDKELEEYLLELQRKNQGSLEGGDWLWPIPLTADQYCSSVYGWRMLWGAWDFHRGWDIACWLGTDIRASKSGTVVISTYHSSYGNYVVIDHGGGISTVYAHASKLLVSKGDKVQKGDVIAKVGTTGSSTGYHLHFEFRKDGKYDDPFNYIPKPPISVGASRYSKS
ncbi:MAG: peptidoglycan DD-metalloendopeptidase family protein [Clostridia bacterium]|nr:peptidoglycan DD-metalloendopeptidase family protein [Clostridia bacterium]